ncbi:PadR family transcriptional regulator [Bacillus massiliigorillae]|uniref:PadR family transcriptional regulator n=1 Tax=Bacillus massiliigorillae TaxID=1243664 RepID=UPI0003A17CCF|nr:PadR family transcriptional regulator [Bacillus massiliigorillae]
MTRLMVLGLLRVKPMSGYEIQQLLLESKTDVWAGILPGSIYHALKKMDKEGLVTISSVETTGNRSKAIYAITEQGEAEFNSLLLESFSSSSLNLPASLYTGLSMLTMGNISVQNEQLLTAIQSQKAQLQAKYEEMKTGMDIKKQHIGDFDPFTDLVYKNFNSQCELQLNCLEQLEQILQSK